MNSVLPKVSVVTITYGHEKYITETLDGVLMQQYPGPIEFIIANDHSPDKTDEVVKTYFQEHPAPENFEIKYTRHPENKGMMPNFIWALEQATGKYIALCEGDDYWTDPLKLQKQVDFLEGNEEFAICFHRVEHLKQDGISYADYDLNANTKEISYLSDLLNGNFIHTPSVVFRNYGDFPDILQKLYPGDWNLHLINATHGKIKFINEYMGVYRIHSGGVHSSNGIAQYIIKNTPSILLISNLIAERGFLKEAKELQKKYSRTLLYYYGIKNIENNSNYDRIKIIFKHGNLRHRLLFWKYILDRDSQKL